MKKLLFVFVLFVIICSIQNTQAQIFDKIKKETEKTIKKETQKPPEVKKEDQKPEEVKTNDETKNSDVTNKTDEEKTSQKPQEDPKFSSSTQYDFVPGDRIILFDDFSQDAVGDFPALWTTNAPGEINTINIAPGNWFNLNSTDGNYFLLKNIEFPKNFIIEFDIVPKKAGGRIAAGLLLYGEDKYKEMDNDPNPGLGGIMLSIEKENWNTWGYKKGEKDKITGKSNVKPVVAEKVNHVIVWVQGRRLRVYHEGAKVLDMPTNIYDGV
ncbi:MAG: hypothetical protein MUE91_12365, partial [Ignavibacteriaceae bacterium]|nr:hypothetical protein [Ignavibacteriaceae bacterium]